MNEIARINTTELNRAGFSEDLMARYIAYLDRSPKTVQSYTRALKPFFTYLAENGITAPTRDDVLAYKTQLKEGHKPSTVQLYIVAVRLFFRWTEQEGIYKNVADHISGAKLDREHKKDYLTKEQLKIIMDNMGRTSSKDKRDYAIFCLMLTGGLRTIEVIRANIEDLTTLGGNTIIYLQGKGKEEKAEYVKVQGHTEKALREYIATREDITPGAPLFTSTSNNNTGGRLTTKTISGIIKESFLLAGYNSDRLTAHSLRHTAVTLSLLAGNTLQEVQQFARHSNIATTQIYAHNLDRANSQCEASIERAVFM